MIKELAYAKVNLALDVVRKREDGYHELKMLMIPIELHDVLTFEESEDIRVISNVDIPDNAVIKAAELFRKKTGVSAGALITLTKHIPIGAGLAGGSADIAATLRGLNRLWQLNLEMKALEDIALTLGSDTLFCLYNRPAYVFGRGEHMLFTHMPPIEKIYLFPSDTNVSTGKVFSHHAICHRPKVFERLFRLYLNDHYRKFFKKTYNHLTDTTLNLYPELKHMHAKIRKLSEFGRMSGSGSTFFIPILKGSKENLASKITSYGLNCIETHPKNEK